MEEGNDDCNVQYKLQPERRVPSEMVHLREMGSWDEREGGEIRGPS